MTKNWEAALPEGYRAAYTIDAKNTKVGVVMNLVGGVLTVALAALLILAIRPQGFFENYSLLRNLWALGALAVYIVLHELVHGAAYQLLTRQKLTFGLSLTVAYCGVPQIWVYRRTALIALLAPFTVFTLLFGGLILLVPDVWDKTYLAVLLALHIGGCVGDLYDTFLYLTRFRDPRTLMQDTGPMQTFYLPEDA